MLRASSPEVLAQTMATAARNPLVAQRLWPVMRQTAPSCTARVVIEPGSLPESGSVSAKQPSASPRCKGVSHFCCSGEPKFASGHITSELCTLAHERKPESARSSSCMRRP